MQDKVAAIFINKCFVFFVAVLILFPLPFFHLMGIGVGGAHFSLILSIFLLPVILLFSKSYWKSKITIAVWGLRILTCISFLLASFRLGITGSELIILGGVLGLTFFYEMGYFLVASGYLRKFLKYWAWLTMIIIAFLFIIISPILLENGLRGLLHQVNYVRLSIHTWPNHFAIYLMITFWIVIFLARVKDKKYLLLLMLILPALFLTFSETAYIALGGTIAFAVWRERRKTRRITAICLILFILLGSYSTYMLVPVSPGYTLDHAVAVRLAIADAVLSQWVDKSVLVGYGFRRVTEIVPVFEWSGKVLQMGSVHNDYIDLLLRGGLLYSIPFWLFVLIVIRKGMRLKYGERQSFQYLLYPIIGLLLAALAQNPFKNPLILAYFWICVAAVAFYNQRSFIATKDKS